MKYTAKYFIEKFEKIPEEMWATGTFGTPDGPKCALGHCREWGDVYSSPTEQHRRLQQLLNSYAQFINDGDPDMRQLGDTPKERILNALMLVEAGVWREIV